MMEWKNAEALVETWVSADMTPDWWGIVHAMMARGYHAEVRLSDELIGDGEYTGTAMFWRGNVIPEGDEREAREAYSGYEGTTDPGVWVRKAAAYALQAESA